MFQSGSTIRDPWEAQARDLLAVFKIFSAPPRSGQMGDRRLRKELHPFKSLLFPENLLLFSFSPIFHIPLLFFSFYLKFEDLTSYIRFNSIL